MNDTSKRTHVVPDVPATADAFGSHQRVANAIAQILSSEVGGKTIGIEGGWGSGKSTVVNLFRDGLQRDPNVAVITFDAWVHEGDPLRRTFLETLILKLRSKGWLDSELGKAKLQELSRRRKETSKVTTPVLTPLAKGLALSAFLVPIGVAYMMAGIKGDMALEAMLYVGVALTILPLLLLLLNTLRKNGEDVWALFVQKTITSETTETIDTPEPTSIEFKTIFAQLAAEALTLPSRRLVIVVDNLDRVSPTEARSIWSVLRTFLEYGDTDRPDWFSKLWIIVPYDPYGLESMLQLEAPSRGQTGEGTGQVPNRALPGFAASFVDKAIQVRFYVAPPVLADWRQFLIERLRTAFPDHEAEDPEFHLVYRVYVARRDVGRIHPTPRDLVLYVNEIGALHRQWGGRFRLSHMAYFALLRKERQDVQRGLLSGDIPSSAEQELLGTDVSECLAALYFNVEVASAGQLLLKEPITASLSSGDAQQLKVLAERHRGFLTVLEHQLGNILSDWTGQENQKIANAARALLNSGIIGATSARERNTFASCFRSAITAMNEWTGFGPESAEGLRCLLTITEQPDIVPVLARTLNCTDPKRTDLTTTEVTQWLEGLLEAISKIPPEQYEHAPEVDEA